MELDIFYRSWWSYMLGGLVALVFGILFLAYPGSTLKTFITILGILFLIDGIINVIRAIVLVLKKESWGHTLIWGIVGLLLGAILINHTEFTLGFVAIIAGIWLIVSGGAALALAFEMPAHSGKGILVVFGIISLGFGIAVLAWTASTLYTLMVVLGFYLIAAAIMDFTLGIYALRFQHREKKVLGESAEEA
jgi:uncharacterized membrane protein HdeD (DUF308 family)